MIQIENISVSRVWESNIQLPLHQLGQVDELIERHGHTFYPQFFNRADRSFEFNWQTWIADLDGFVIVIDPCAGNGRDRPGILPLHQLNTPFLNRFEATGYRPDQVDAVFCTHLHCDHCGWNTKRHGDSWVPTFPNAKYYFVAKELQRWNPENPGYRHVDYNTNVFEDSVKPILEAGLAEIVSANDQIGPGVTIWPAYGHSDGHCALRVDHRGTRLWFTGDAFHHPLQVIDPRLSMGGDDDPALAIATRKALRSIIASEGSYFIPAHFASPHTGRIVLEDGGFRFAPLGE